MSRADYKSLKILEASTGLSDNPSKIVYLQWFIENWLARYSHRYSHTLTPAGALEVFGFARASTPLKKVDDLQGAASLNHFRFNLSILRRSL